MTIKLPFSLEAARHGDPVIYEDMSPVIELAELSKAKTPIVSVDAERNLHHHLSDGTGGRNIFMAATGVLAEIKNDIVEFEGGSFPLQQLFDDSYLQQGNFHDDYLNRVMSNTKTHPLCQAYIEEAKKHGFLINTLLKRIYFIC